MSNFTVITKTKAFSTHHVDSTEWLVRESGSDWSFRVIHAPFENCQTFGISPFRRILRSDSDYENIEARLNEIREVCEISKRLCQIDVRKEVFNKLKPHIPIEASMEYVNLTGSPMVMALLFLENK